MKTYYTVAKTTVEERQKIVNSALAISTLDAIEPSKELKLLSQKYIKGELEISNILKATIDRYMVEA